MMKISKRLLEILASKPDLMVDFPEWMLPHSTIKQTRATENVAIAEIAGRDSLAAVVRACELRPITAIVPTLAYTGTEYGNWKTPLEKVSLLKKILKQKNLTVFDPVILGSPRFWWELCGRYVTHLTKQFGFFSHCIACHLYLHSVRIPLAKKLQINIVIGGERELHDGKIKINQIKEVLDAYQDFFNKFDLELFLPLRDIESGKQIESIIGMPWDEGQQQLKCVLSKNYRESDDSVILNKDAIRRFLDEFALKKAEQTIRAYLQKLN